MIRNNKLISDNRSVSSMSVHGGSTTTILPDGDLVSRKNKKRNFQRFRSQGIKLLKNQTTQVKEQKWIVVLMKKYTIKNTTTI